MILSQIFCKHDYKSLDKYSTVYYDRDSNGVRNDLPSKKTWTYVQRCSKCGHIYKEVIVID